MKITKALSNDVACNMCKDTIDKRIKEKNETLSLRGYKLVAESKNPDLLAAFNKWKSYFNSYAHAYFVYNNSCNLSVYISESLPSDSGSHRIQIDKKVYEELNGLLNDIQSLISEREKMKENIKSTLFSLSTIKKVQEQFPEAIKYFPEEELTKGEMTSISIPIEAIKDSLKKYTN